MAGVTLGVVWLVLGDELVEERGRLVGVNGCGRMRKKKIGGRRFRVPRSSPPLEYSLNLTYLSLMRK